MHQHQHQQPAVTQPCNPVLPRGPLLVQAAVQGLCRPVVVTQGGCSSAWSMAPPTCVPRALTACQNHRKLPLLLPPRRQLQRQQQSLVRECCTPHHPCLSSLLCQRCLLCSLGAVQQFKLLWGLTCNRVYQQLVPQTTQQQHQLYQPLRQATQVHSHWQQAMMPLHLACQHSLCQSGSVLNGRAPC